ncbi:MAG: 16S rRNA (cytosine(1402)-N(4))-methyltransferase [Candidatus Levybacteria bacterium RIFCSPLOWO2_02_FULL_36_8b]|nr:MAG: 16S rRNA (cytosine(1402)-N(4))-methyltransferase [Candidatus Levybacteria bacterium RIFCSPLOWO2_02_FULL_36_8b]
MSNFHKPVLLKEIIEGLGVKKGKKYIDATVGGGGHSFEILRLGGIVLGVDVDRESLEYIKKLGKPENLTLARGNFRDIDKIALLNNFDRAAGIIFDLGVSSHQIDNPTRGFSFQNEGPLDMRMDRELGVRALDLIKILTKKELCEIFTKYSEESYAWEIADAIVKARSIRPIETTRDLAKIAFSIAGQSKKIFQALRIVVNDELNAIAEALPKALGLLDENGMLCVISFHSLEDRIVKKKFAKFEEEHLGKIITKKPIVPSAEELMANSRAKSAKLRIFKK